MYISFGFIPSIVERFSNNFCSSLGVGSKTYNRDFLYFSCRQVYERAGGPLAPLYIHSYVCWYICMSVSTSAHLSVFLYVHQDICSSFSM